MAASLFYENVIGRIGAEGLETVSAGALESRIFMEYGAVFLTAAVPPPRSVFESEEEVSEFQESAGFSGEVLDGDLIELQPAAMKSLLDSRKAAAMSGLSISARGGAEAGRRNFEKTLQLWKSRFEPALEHWKEKGRLVGEQIEHLRALPVKKQVLEVLDLEEQGIYFNTFFDNSILYSVAAPGTSQHLSMLAFDVAEFADRSVQSLLADHGWFRTVQNDAPHFTFLGRTENELTGLGLMRIDRNDGPYWIPDL